jgi:hypothetical protein
MLLVRALLDSLSYMTADQPRSDEAGILRPPELPSLDAIHLAAARALGTNLSAPVTYDERLADAAGWNGMPVVSPYLTEGTRPKMALRRSGGHFGSRRRARMLSSREHGS